MNIITSYICPPIPNRNFDWIAYFKDNEEGISGFGSTEKEAIENLKEKLKDESA